MQKTCDFSACNHCDSPETCGLNQLGIGCKGSVFAVGGDTELRRRLLEMAIEFRLRGYHLSLREEQARHVKIVRA
jgi:Fe2+ transport system protein FeoA